jgi:hypothetical protein
MSSEASSRFRVLIHSPATEYLAKLAQIDRDDAIVCANVLEALAENPSGPTPSLNILRWRGPEFDFRLKKERHNIGYRVDKRRRIVYVIDMWFE